MAHSNDDDANLRVDAAQILACVECVICREPGTSMYTCINGHLTCAECLQSQAQANGDMGAQMRCALCRDASGWNRDRLSLAVLETVEAHVGAPFLRCDHEHCTERVHARDLETHRRTCPMRKLECPIDHCSACVLAGCFVDHCRGHAEVVRMTEHDELQLMVNNFALDRVVLVESRHGGAAVFHVTTVGIHGNPGMYELQQGLLRVCQLEPATPHRPWRVDVFNVSPLTGSVVETFHAEAQIAAKVDRCCPIAHPSVHAKGAAIRLSAGPVQVHIAPRRPPTRRDDGGDSTPDTDDDAEVAARRARGRASRTPEPSHGHAATPRSRSPMSDETPRSPHARQRRRRLRASPPPLRLPPLLHAADVVDDMRRLRRLPMPAREHVVPVHGLDARLNRTRTLTTPILVLKFIFHPGNDTDRDEHARE